MRTLQRASLVVALLMIASTASAGTKKSTKIKVTNKAPVPIFVAIDADEEDFEDEGVWVNPGSSKSFKVKAGKHYVTYVYATDPESPETKVVKVKKNQTKTVTIKAQVVPEDEGGGEEEES